MSISVSMNCYIAPPFFIHSCIVFNIILLHEYEQEYNIILDPVQNINLYKLLLYGKVHVLQKNNNMMFILDVYCIEDLHYPWQNQALILIKQTYFHFGYLDKIVYEFTLEIALNNHDNLLMSFNKSFLFQCMVSVFLILDAKFE